MSALERFSRLTGVAFLALAVMIILLPGSNLRRWIKTWTHSRSARLIVEDSLSGRPMESRLIGSRRPTERLFVVTDYSCGYCAMFADSVVDLLAKDSSRAIVLLFHQSTDWSQTAARAALCAGNQGYLESMDRFLFSVIDSIPESQWGEVARQLELPSAAAFLECRHSEAVNSELASDSSLLEVLGVAGTPAFLSIAKGLRIGLLPNAALDPWFDSRN